MRFRVRKTEDSTGEWAVANGKKYTETTKYITLTGEVTSRCFTYNTEAEAVVALALYEESLLNQPPAEKSEDRSKPSNPKYALGIKKVPLHVVPCHPLLEVALAFMEGGRKYGTHNYREIGVRASTYYNAALRHLMAWWEGEDIDPESGVHHVVKAIACLFVVRDSMHMNNMTDDRPIRYPEGLPMDEINKIAGGIIKAYPECKAPFTHKKDCND